MLRYIEKIIVPFVNERRGELKLPKSHHALAIFDCFKGAQTHCIINKWNQPAAKECNRKLYYRQKLKKNFSVRSRMGI